VAISLDNFWSNKEREIVGYADRTFDLQGRPGLRHVADDAIDRCGGAENDRPSFDGAKSRTAALLGHLAIYDRLYFRPVKCDASRR